MDSLRRCILQDSQRSPAPSLGGLKKPDSLGNLRVVIPCAGRGRSPREGLALGPSSSSGSAVQEMPVPCNRDKPGLRGQ